MQSNDHKIDDLCNTLASCSIGSSDGSTEKEKHVDKKSVRVSSSVGTFQGSTSLLRRRSLFTAGKTKFNPTAPPFVSQSSIALQQEQAILAIDRNQFDIPISRIGPTQLAVNSRIWNSIAAQPSRSLEDLNNRGMTSCCDTNHHLPGPISAHDMDAAHQFGPIAMPNGTIQIRLREGIKIDMTVDKSVRIVNSKTNIVIALSGTSSSAALMHPNGQVFQHGSLVDIVAHDGMKRNRFVRYAKMWQKGISLTSEGCALIYLVDSAGTRTTSDVIAFDINRDYTVPVFLSGSHQGPQFSHEANVIVNNTTYWLNDDSSETFDINGFRITQTADGLVRLTRANNKCILRTSPSNGSATITTPFIHCTASLGQTSHLFVRRGEKRMHFGGASFVVRNAGHSAGFDEYNRLRVY